MEKNLKVHRHHENLTGEHPVGDAGQLIFLFVFLIAWIVDSFFIKYSVSLNEIIPVFIRIPLALVVLSVSFVLAKKGLKIVFGNPDQEAEVFDKGVFRVVRHPVYLGAILLYLGFLLISFSLIAAGIWIAIILFYYFISRYEEKLLVERFGKEYEEYKKKVPMLFPYKYKTEG